MKYFYDTEFIEDGKTIDLISIAIVAEDGREFYRISIDFNEHKASQWVMDNVISHLPKPRLNNSGVKLAQSIKGEVWRSRNEIRDELVAFIGDDKPEFWAYYADYDHVALCQLFGTMMDLPPNFPMYTRDLKQLLDSVGNPQMQKPENEHHALVDAKWVKDVYFKINPGTIGVTSKNN